MTKPLVVRFVKLSAMGLNNNWKLSSSLSMEIHRSNDKAIGGEVCEVECDGFDLGLVTVEFGGEVKSDRFSLKDFSVRIVSVCHVANVGREGRDLKSYGGNEIDELVFGVRFEEFRLRSKSCCTQRL
nr:hypothetical protein CFP56_20085 [Quercus suber]